MKILLVNDDGIDSPGLQLLAKELGREHTVVVVAPDGNRSAVSHGLTMRMPILVRQVQMDGCLKAYAISGNPADCTRLGIAPLMGDEMDIDLVISGPNLGYNVSFDILYSGTAAGALEGAMWGKKAIALSASTKAKTEDVVEIFLALLRQLDVQRDIRHVLNINIPALPKEQIKGVKWVHQGLFHQWSDRYEHRRSPVGQDYYWINGVESTIPPSETDSFAVQEGYISLTPISFDLTDEQGFRDRELTL